MSMGADDFRQRPRSSSFRLSVPSGAKALDSLARFDVRAKARTLQTKQAALDSLARFDVRAKARTLQTKQAAFESPVQSSRAG